MSVLRREYEEKTAPKVETKSLEDPEELYRQALLNVLRREYEEKTAPKAEAKSLEDPEKLYRRAMQTTDELERVELLSQASFQGHVLAQTALGMLYREQGKMKLAADLFQKAAVGKNGEACFQLSHCYRDGLGVKTSASSAIHWLRRAAELGQVKGVLELADALLVGGDVEKDPDKAEEYYQKAAKMGAPEGLVHLAWCYRDGKHVPRSRTKAWELLNQASKYGSTEANVLLHSPEFQPVETKTGTSAGSTQTKTGTSAGSTQTKTGTSAGSTQTKTGTGKSTGSAQTKSGTSTGSAQTKSGTSTGSAQTKSGTSTGSAQTKTGKSAGSTQTKTGTSAGSAQTKTGTSAGSTQTKTGTSAGTTQTKTGTGAGTTQTQSKERGDPLDRKTLQQLRFGKFWRGFLFYLLTFSNLMVLVGELSEGSLKSSDLPSIVFFVVLCWILGKSYFRYRAAYKRRIGQAGNQ